MPPPQDVAGDQITILLVDDEEIVLKVTGRMITELGSRALPGTWGRDQSTPYRRGHARHIRL